MNDKQFFIWLRQQWKMDHDLWETIYSRLDSDTQTGYVAYLIKLVDGTENLNA